MVVLFLGCAAVILRKRTPPARGVEGQNWAVLMGVCSLCEYLPTKLCGYRNFGRCQPALWRYASATSEPMQHAGCCRGA